MNENEKDFMENLTDLDDESVEEIAEDYPALDGYAQNRILKQCLRKSGLPDGDIEVTENTDAYEDDDYEDEISVSGIERYDRPLWHKYVSSVAVMVIAVVGIASVVALHGNLNNSDDFDISSPPVVSDVVPSTNIQKTEIVTGSYIDRGYNANGFDFANENDYQGIVVGTTAVTESVDSGDVTDIVESSESDNNEYVPEQNNQSQVTVPPETVPPVTAPPVTETPTAPPATESVADNTQSEVQKSFLNGLYYVDISDISGYMGFEFTPDGILTKYAFDDYGNVINNTIVKTNYEIVENQFSFGDLDRQTGTIVNPNDSGNFTVQFEDGLYTFHTESPTFETSGITLSGLWFGNSSYGLRKLEFYSDTSGSFIYTNDITNVEFEYKIENNHVCFIVYGDTLEGDIIRDYDGQRFTVLWNDGTTEYFYDEKTWWEMNE